MRHAFADLFDHGGVPKRCLKETQLELTKRGSDCFEKCGKVFMFQMKTAHVATFLVLAHR